MTPWLGRCGLGEAPTSAIVLASRRICSGDRTRQGYPRAVALAAVLFDVDFTLAKPGPDLGPEGYRVLGARFGLELDPDRYDEARAGAIETLERHPELEHDEEVWVAFTERIVRGMGGDADGARACALEM